MALVLSTINRAVNWGYTTEYKSHEQSQKCFLFLPIKDRKSEALRCIGFDCFRLNFTISYSYISTVQEIKFQLWGRSRGSHEKSTIAFP